LEKGRFTVITLKNLVPDNPYPTTAQRCRSAREKNTLEDLFSSVVLRFHKYHPFGNPTFNNVGIFQCLKFRTLIEKNLPISLKLDFTPNSLGG